MRSTDWETTILAASNSWGPTRREGGAHAPTNASHTTKPYSIRSSEFQWSRRLVKSPRCVHRRSFLMCAASAGAAGGIASACGACYGNAGAGQPRAQDDAQFIVEAQFYQKLPNKKIKCKLCPRECAVGDRERGYCGVRENRNGVYYTLVHSRVCAAHVDPVEKKPLFHYLPGSHGVFAGHGGLQRELQVLPELGYLAGAPGAGASTDIFRRSGWRNWLRRCGARRLPTPTASRWSSASS